MTDYLKEYTSALNNYSTIKQMVTKNHISHYSVLDEMLGFQYYLNKKFVEFYNSIKDPTELKKYMPELSIHSLFFYNTQSLQSALNDVECDRIHQSAVNIRTVYESIPKMYYISLFPEENGFIMVHEHLAEMRFQEAMIELKKEDCTSYLNGQELKFESKNAFYDFKRKYMPNAFRKKLYSQKRQELLQKLYSKFSNSTHPNITRNKTSVRYEPKDTELFFEFLKTMSYFNIQAYSEGNIKLLLRIGIHKEIIEFLNAKAKQLQTFYEEVYFFPDNKDLDRKLKTSVETRID